MKSHLDKVEDWAFLARQAKWSVSMLARMCNVSSRTLERHFLEARGECPRAWLSRQKRRVVVEMIKQGLSTKEIAARLGVSHPSSLSRNFKRLTGVTMHRLKAQLKA